MSSVGGVTQPNYSVLSQTSMANATGDGSLDINDFYTLLATQIKYQDADNPMDTAEMMNQMVQMQMIEAITQMSQINATSYSMSMVGQSITVAELDESGAYTGSTSTGVVTGVLLGEDPLIFIGENAYTLSQIMSVGAIPDLTPPEEGTEEVPPVDEGDGTTEEIPPTDGTGGTEGTGDTTDTAAGTDGATG